MPPWGRPPGGLDPRSKREWERQAQAWMEQNRFEELPSDDEDGVSFDVPSNARARRQRGYDDLAYGDDYDPLEILELDQDDAWNLAMREKEEELCERAMRRIRRARLRGESNVHLTREELDALERRKAREAAASMPPVEPQPRSTRGTLPSAAPKSTKPSAAKAKTRSHDDDRASDHARAATPDNGQPVYRTNSGNYIARQASPKTVRSSGRVSSGGSSRQPSLVESNYYESGPSRHAPGIVPSSSRESLSRSLPDDPDWTPRSRSSSSARVYSTDPFAYQTTSGPVPYAAERRRTSGGSTVSYSSVRRAPASAVANAAANGGTVRMPMSQLGTTVSDPTSRSSGSGVPEVINISSDDSEESEDDDSDQGVRVVEAPEDYVQSSSRSTRAGRAHQRRSGGGRR